MEWRNVNLATLLVGFLLLLGCTKAQEKGDSVIKMVEDPTGNVNLAPFMKIRSAYECLQNISDACPVKYRLTTKGWVNVTAQDTGDYCKNCAHQTDVILTCIRLVMSDYQFEDRTTVAAINNTISQGCALSHGFTGKILPFNDARMMHASKTVVFASALIAWLLISSIHM